MLSPSVPAVRRPSGSPARPRRAARSPYSADATLWASWCAHVGARLDADGRAADAVAWCAAGRARAFALPSKLRTLDAAGVARTLARTAAGERHPAFWIHVVRVGEGAGRPVVLACDGTAPDGQIGAHHVGWLVPVWDACPAARRLLSVVVTRATGGTVGRSHGLNVALVGIGPALRVAAALPAPALVTVSGRTVIREPAPGYRLGRAPAGRGGACVPLGHVVATPGALDLADAGVDLLAHLARHEAGDWGNVDAHDAAANAEALDLGGRLVSSYETAAGTLWIITEADRTATTLLRPDDY